MGAVRLYVCVREMHDPHRQAVRDVRASTLHANKYAMRCRDGCVGQGATIGPHHLYGNPINPLATA